MQTKQTNVTNLYQNGNFVTEEMKKSLGQLVVFIKENLPVR